ncbi:hypothetical protein GH714_026987 [Hevea brasiliensis]|uniref:Auxin response factor n=1 Tax=Hevea brasiliensis TaxID=3981 RepID=A0A6A6N638_HEVBR|nr:hypothetical protein GH714_026987 [Hevea brasiliensis]
MHMNGFIDFCFSVGTSCAFVMASVAMNHSTEGHPQDGGCNDALYKQLWHACAGPLVSLPFVGEQVYYFPQAWSSGTSGLEQQMPPSNLPSKILCKVIKVDLQADPKTDQVCAYISLLPEPDDMSQEPPCQQLVAKDLHGKQWHFQHIYRGNPKRHLLTTGWGEFVGSKKLAKATRSVLIFLREENGELRIGVRKPMGQETDVVKHGESICSGILSNAYHAMMTRNHFYVIYRPRTTGSQFIVSVNMYREAQKPNLFNGMRFMMKFEGEEGCEKSFNGRIVHFQDNISSRWPDSEWRSIKVQWDKPCPPFLPERVSPWELELSSQPKQRKKRAQVGFIGDASQLKRTKGKGKFKEICSTVYEKGECSNVIQGNFIAQSTRAHVSERDGTEKEGETEMNICVANAHGDVIPQENSGPTEKNGHRDGIGVIDDETNVQCQDKEYDGILDESLTDIEKRGPTTPASAEYPILPEIHTLDVLPSDSPVFPTSQGERVEYSRQYSLDDCYEDFYGFQVLQTHVSDLQRIYCIEGKFWENSRFQRAYLISAVLEGLGLALSLKDRTWKSLSPDELQTIIQGIEDALNAGFKLDCLKPVVQKAKAVSGSFDTRCQFEALEEEKSSLETRLQNSSSSFVCEERTHTWSFAGSGRVNSIMKLFVCRLAFPPTNQKMLCNLVDLLLKVLEKWEVVAKFYPWIQSLTNIPQHAIECIHRICVFCVFDKLLYQAIGHTQAPLVTSCGNKLILRLELVGQSCKMAPKLPGDILNVYLRFCFLRSTFGSAMASKTTNHFTGGGCDYALYKELWHACAGPLVTLPRAGERVYYFPQGHMEQLGAPVHEGLEQEMLPFNLPSKILCRVIYVQRMAEPETDKVYAQIVLLPELDDMSQQPPRQELVATDLHRNKWHFRHIFRGKPKRHLLTTGWSSFVSSKKLAAGDVFIFLRGENGRLQVGVRRLMRQEINISSVTSSENMHVEVLASASHAMATGTLFTILYRPRTSRSDFIVSVNKYLDAQKNVFSIGKRFKMRFEVEQVLEQSCSFNGTIVGIEDVSSRWPGSRWRCLKVQWDEASSISRPESVSPWEVELPVAVTPPNSLPGQGKKRPEFSLRGHLHWTMVNVTFPFIVSLPPVCFDSSSATSKTSSLGFSGFSSEATLIESSASAADEEPRKVGDACPVLSLDADSGQHSETSNIICRSEIRATNCEPQKPCQVKMQGIAVRRSVDLTQLECHEDLLRQLEKMFEIEGELIGSTEKWKVVYTDDEGDMMLFGDEPWHEFFSMVREISIYTTEKVKRKKSRSG